MAAPPRTPLRTRARRAAIRGALVLGVLAGLRCVAYAVGKEDARAILEDRAESHLVDRRDYLASRLEDVTAQSAPGGQFGGEWVLVTLSMTALATTNLAFSYPDTVPRAKTILARCRELALAKETRAFDRERWGDDPLDTLASSTPHIGYLGHLAIILEAERILGGPVDAHEGPVLDALRRRASAGASPVLETYPGERYVPDNVVVAAAIAMSALDAPGKGERRALAAPILARYLSWFAKLEGDGSLMVFRADEHGAPVGHSRGSGGGWNSLYLPFIDGAFALRQATALRGEFQKHLGPFGSAVCEYRGCAPGAGDVDSGPVVFGTSPSGTGFGLAAAKTLDDVTFLDGMLSTSEWVGVTLPFAGKRRFLLAPLVGDAIVLAGMSSRKSGWDGRYLSH